MGEEVLIVIIPVHEVNEDVKNLLPNAIKSVPEDISIRISCPNGVGKEVSPIVSKFKNVVIYEGDDANKKSFPELVNQAIGQSQYFSVLEFDDVYTPIWLENFKTYVDFYSDVSIFMYLEDLYDYQTKNYIGFGNEAPLASSFSNELGEIDNDCLQDFFDFYMTGSIFKTDDFVEIGKLKTNIPIVFWYEFMLRATNKNKRLMVIPKVGYVHYLDRKGSLLDEYRNKYTEKESEYWFNIAKKESFYNIQRDVKPYDSETEED